MKKFMKWMIGVIALLFILMLIPAKANSLEFCQYAISATATSESIGSKAIYAVGSPNAPKPGCSGWSSWSGYGYSWSPANWNVKANITLKYEKPLYVSNFTIFGDYDMCWSRIWIKNSTTGEKKLVFTGTNANCTSTKKLDESFLADTIILETCGWSWSSTDAVRMCGVDRVDRVDIIQDNHYYDTFNDETGIEPNLSFNYSVSNGDVQIYSAGNCYGTANACNALNNQSVCQGQPGCSWDVAGPCSGACMSCRNFKNTTTCTAQQGCKWYTHGSYCYGSCASCTNFKNTTTCTAQQGCSWDLADCYGAAYACNVFRNESSCQRQNGCYWNAIRPKLANIVSKPITSLASWSRFYADDTSAEGTDIGYAILNATSNDTISGYEDLTGDGDDLSNLSVYPVRLKATLTTINDNTPILHEWNISWNTSRVGTGKHVELCQYAAYAEATDEMLGYEARYSTKKPDSDGDCKTQSLRTAWQKSNWNVVANLTLTFSDPIYPSNLTIFGDFELCIYRVWFWKDSSWYLAWDVGIDKSAGSDCKIFYDFSSLNFKTSKVKIEPCDWVWSSIDAVEFCGPTESFPKINIAKPSQDRVINSSKQNITLEISTDIASTCKFSYDKNFDFSDGTNLSTVDGITHSYNLSRPVSTDAIAIYYRCKGFNGKTNPYSVMHRFKFRDVNESFIEICNWYNCSEGAASISMDDPYQPYNIDSAVCRENLEAAGLKGTYFLSYTNKYSQSDWEIWRDVYNAGHEIAGHSRLHNCTVPFEKNSLISDTETNINDIINNIGMPREELTTYAWPCGVTSPLYQEWLSEYYLFARGYHFNSIESKNPENFMNYKSINTPGVGVDPPDYYTVADATENYQDWAIYVYHNSCDNPEIMDYLVAKDLWVETIGTVSKYIKERQNVQMQNIRGTPEWMTFDLVNSLNTTIFDKNLTLRIYLGNGTVDNITVNGNALEFTRFMTGDQAYVKFDVPSLSVNTIEINGSGVTITYCGDGKINQGSEECDDGNLLDGDGCNSNCKREMSGSVYVILYVGNIDGNASTAWYPFYDRLTKYFEDNKIPVGFSFFPATIRSDNDFAGIFKRMYLADNIELFQKAFTMNKTEEKMDQLPFEEQKNLIKAGQNYYIERMKEILNSTDIDIPVTYVAGFGRFTTDTRRAIEELGFRSNFGLYYPPELKPVPSTATIDSIQYGVSFTTNGAAGRETAFKQPDEIIQQVKSYYRLDVPMLTVYGKRVIPLYVHHPDFEDSIVNGKINETKWAIYNETIARLTADPDITFVTPNQVWNMRHPTCIPTGISESFCNGVDDDCDGVMDEDYISTPTTCGVGPCQSTGMLECRGYEISTCEPGVPAAEDSVCDGIDDDCDGVIDEDCALYYCRYANSATATSESIGSKAIYALGSPNAPKPGCSGWSSWSGYGYNWNPSSWSVKANLTLKYEKPVYASNFTVFGDYDMCWSRMWIKNSNTGEQKLVFSGTDTSCTSMKKLDESFLADTIILETCGISWSSTDAVELCGRKST